jgi:Tfp pilus assembly protein PilN
MGVSVELFDPFRVVETDGLSPEESDLLEEYQLESVVALGLATMASDAESYSIEILPESVRKRRDLMGGTAFLIAAVVFAIAYLGWSAMTLSNSLGELEGEVRVASRRLQDAKRTEKQAFDLQQKSAVLNEYAEDLMLTLGTGEQLARSLEALHKSLPEEFWLTNLETKIGQDKDLLDDKEEQPFLRIEGRAREGTRSMSVLYEQFLARLRAELPMARITASPNVRGTQFELALTLFGGPDPEAAELDMNEEDS